ncbi:MAG: hypothetical protein HY074_00730 [Deltaproteobacteria bacterium]|nr:hypothetical protein [Deltaproteobacteria bacterium]
MRKLFSTILTLAVCAFSVFSSIQAAEQVPGIPAGSSSARKMKFDPRLAAEYVELLKHQADERKEFYAGRAKASEELHAQHVTQRTDLVATHRKARHRFEEEKHTRNERSGFFKSQRSDMTALEARQKADFLGLDADLEKKLLEFHERQRKERDELTGHLLKSHH